MILVASLASACSEPPVPPLKVSVGDLLPDFSTRDVHEKPVTLAAKTGKLLIVNVWATWCGPCRYELPSLDRLAEILGPKQVSIVGVSVDEDSHVLREYLIEHKVRFPSYWDPQRHITDEILGVRVFPSTFFVGADGRLKKVVEGWREWDAPESVAEIRALMDGAHPAKSG